MTSIESLVPKLTIPTVASMLHGRNLNKDPQEAVFEQVAEQQLEEEKDDTNFFFKMLDYLGRPQAAVAGVLTDAIDGGDFSPLDRVGHALMGKERYRMKDFIDVVAPGQWSNVKLPDWLGGKNIDLSKEVLGFTADVLTDPLMATRTFSFLGKASRFGPEEAAKLFHIARKEGLGSEVHKVLRNRIGEEQATLGIASGVSDKFSITRTQMRELHNLWEEAAKDPKAFRSMLKTPAAQKEFDVLEKSFTHTASPVLSERFAAGEQALIAVKMPWLMKKLGLPDGQWSLIPKLDKEWGQALAKGFEDLTSRVMNTPAGVAMKQGVARVFRSGTGSKLGDYITANIHALERKDLANVDEIMGHLRKTIGPDYTEEIGKVVAFHLGHSRDLLKGRVRITASEIPDVALRAKAQKVTDQMYKLLESRQRLHHAIPGSLKHGLIKGLDDPMDRYRAWGQKVEWERGKEVVQQITPYSVLAKAARTKTRSKVKKLVETRGLTSPSEIRNLRKTLYKTNLEKAVLEEIERGAHWVNDMIPLVETSYFPRRLTTEAKELFQNLLFNPGVRYKGRPAGDVFYNHFKTRNLVQYDVKRWNEMFQRMNEVYAPGFMEEIIKSAKKNLSGKQSNILGRFLGELELPQLKMYVDDPFQAVSTYLYGSVRAVGDQQRMNALTKMFARPMDQDELVPLFGETPVILSPEGMTAVYGDNWRNVLGENAAKIYEEEIARGRLTGAGDTGGLFFSLQNELHSLSKMKAFNVPVHAIPGEIFESIQKLERLNREPQTWIPFLRSFDKVTNWWKSWTLAIFPSYHARNFISGFWQSFLGDSASTANYSDAARVFFSGEMWRAGSPWTKNTLKSAGERLENIVITEKGYNGARYLGTDLMRDMEKHNIPMTGLLGEEIINEARRGHTQETLFGMGKNHPLRVGVREFTSPGKGYTIGTGFWVGNMADNWHRTAHFIDRIKKGYSPYEAAQSVKKYFFDYSELGSIEKAVFRRVFPFYTWARKNIPLQLEHLATKPGKFAAMDRAIRFFQSDEAKEFDPKLLPKWVSENLGIPTRINHQTGNVEVKLLNTWSPAADLKNIGSLKAFFENAISMAHPIPKVILESATNYSTFTRRPIEEYPDEPYGMPFLGMDLTKKQVHQFKSLRLANEVNKFISARTLTGELPFNQRLVDAIGFTPKTKAFSVEGLKKTRQYEIAKRKGAIKRGYRRAGKISTQQQQKFIKKVKNAAGLDRD